MIEVKGLGKQYNGKDALRDMSFAIGQGETCALIGLKSAGKTTLMDMLSGVLENDAGSIALCGCDMAERPYEAKRHVGYMPAVPPLFKDMTPRRSLRFVAEAWGVSLREINDRIDQVLKETRLSEVSDTPARNLNESARRMLSLAQALLMDPEILLIDEPTDGLEIKDAIELRRIIASYSGKKTILVATRNLTEVKALCSRALVLDVQRLVADVPTDQLWALELNTNELHVRVLGAEQAAKDALSALKGAKLTSAQPSGEPDACDLVIEMTGDLRAQIATALLNARLPILEMKRGTRSAEQLMAQLTDERVDAGEKGDVPGDESDL